MGRINTRYWILGETGPPVVLIHGIGQFVEHWLSAIHALSAHHKVYALDLPGHGKTDKPQDVSYTIEEYAQFVKDFMSALGIEKAHIVGHSLGGAISIHLIVNHKNVVDRLVLVDSGGLGSEVSIVFRISTPPWVGEIVTWPSLLNSRVLLRMFAYDPASITDEYIALHYRMSSQPNAQRALLKTLRSNLTLWRQVDNSANMEQLPSIQNPVLVIWGRQDNAFPLAHADTAAKAFPNVRVKVIENCGHIAALEQPLEFNQLLVDFLKP